jgi:hypothetical protein
MARANRPPKPTREQRKADRAASRQTRREQYRAIREAFTLTRQSDKRLIPYLLLTFLGAVVLVWGLGYLLTGWLWVSLIPAVLIGVLLAMILFSRRAQRSAYDKAEGQPGAAIYVLKNLRGDWRVTEAVAATTQLDAVHRVIGRPGVVLIAEGAPHRVKSLLAQEKKRVARVAGDAPIYDLVVGADTDLPLRALSVKLMRLPRNLSKEQVSALDRRLAVLGQARMPIPQGPIPQGAKMRGMQRTVRRRGGA